ncbi:hypothetical protein [Cellulophaga sp. L1A9]|uniref:hypothetical protein n=1 Tax=Cellulophaga sp. L1A9 TaxID=2686362 RepID=UPI00131AD7A0|nr:hypothetical protein [Cellulophaga sp. L1A9]
MIKMNNLFYIIMITSLFTSNIIYAQKNETDKVKMGLKKKVKTVTLIKIKCPSESNGTKFHCPTDTITYNFDKKGNQIKKFTIKRDTIIKTYRNDTLITLEYNIGDKGKILQPIRKIYSKNKLLVKTIVFKNGLNNRPSMQWEYSYDNNDLKIKQIFTQWHNKKLTTVYDYNERGDIKKEQNFKNDQLATEKNYNYKYVDDKKGNWIIKKVYGGEYKITEKRKIIYY